MTNETQNTDNQNEQLTDLTLIDEQAEQTKGGSLKYNFGGIEGAASAVQGSVSAIQGLIEEG